jgi:hypothetical protein
MKTIDCPVCYGEGYLENAVPGGRFDPRSEQWYPAEQQRECPLCRGQCTIGKSTHDNLFNLTSDYQQLKSKRKFRRSTKNDVALGILGDKAA